MPSPQIVGSSLLHRSCKCLTRNGSFEMSLSTMRSRVIFAFGSTRRVEGGQPPLLFPPMVLARAQLLFAGNRLQQLLIASSCEAAILVVCYELRRYMPVMRRRETAALYAQQRKRSTAKGSARLLGPPQFGRHYRRSMVCASECQGLGKQSMWLVERGVSAAGVSLSYGDNKRCRPD